MDNHNKNNIEINIYNFRYIRLSNYFSLEKIITYILGMLTIIALGIFLKLPDWDIYLSIIMPTSTFMSCGITTGKVVEHYLKKSKSLFFWIILWIIFFEFNVDIIYVLYNTYVNHMYFRIPNFIGSSTLYLLCCFIFSYNKKIIN